MQLQELFLLIKSQKFKQAVLELNKFLSQSPNHLDGLNLLGVAHNQLGDFKSAKKAFAKAVAHYGDHFQSQLNLALCQIQLNDFDNATSTLLKCDELKVDHPDVLNALGNIYRIEGKLVEAELKLKKAYALTPQNPAIFENLAWLALKKGNTVQAAQQFTQLNKAFPQKASISLGLAECQIKQNNLSNAEHVLGNILRHQPQHAEAHLMLSSIFNKSHHVKRLHHLQQAIKYNPKLAAAQFELGLAYQEVGNEIKSTEHFEAVVDLKPTWFEAYFHLAYKRDYHFSDVKVAHLTELCKTQKNAQDLYWLYFAIAKVEDKRKNYEQAFINFKKARQHFSTKSLEDKETKRPFDELKNTLPNLAEKSTSSYQFIFVTGMPRSGTTLTDQILDCHSTVHSIGESGLISQLAYRVEKKTNLPYYKGVELLTDSEKSSLVVQVLTERQLSPCSTLVDTTPNNIFYSSFILSLIPNSKIIFCKRSPLDTCLSIYQYPLAQQGYANDLAKLGKFYKQSDKLINHWREVFPKLTTVLFYEQLTSSPEQEIKKLLYWLELPFESSCLNPQDNSRHVLTPSSEQVRKPINKTAIGKWRNFSPYIDELTTILSDYEHRYQLKLKG